MGHRLSASRWVFPWSPGHDRQSTGAFRRDQTWCIGWWCEGVLRLAMTSCTISIRTSVGGMESPCPTRTIRGGYLHTIGNDGNDRALRILEGVKATDIWDVGQGHDGFSTEFLRL